MIMIRAGLVLLLLVAAVPAGAHSWYTGLRNRSGISCCEDRDCRPVGLCVLPGKREGVEIEGVCRPIPWDKVLDLPSPDGGPGDLIACALVDALADGLSLVYSFYEPSLPRRSLGSFIILDHVVQARLHGIPYVYLGYWVPGSPKMDYKARFRPIEVLKDQRWTVLGRAERDRNRDFDDD